MKQKILVFFLIFLAAITQISLWPNFFPEHAAPDVVLILVIIWSVANNFSSIWIKIIAAGIILDIISLNPIGLNVFSFLIISLVTCFLAKRFFIDRKTADFFASAGLIIIGTAINFLIISVLVLAQNYFLKNISFVFLNLEQFRDLAIKEVGNLLIFALIYWPMKKIGFNFQAQRQVL